MANFKIQFLDTYPVYAFAESFEMPEAVFDRFFHETVKTEDMWGHVYDSIKDNRTIQNITYEIYKAEVIFGRNIDLFKLNSSNHVLVTPDNGAQFNALKFNIEVADSPNRDKVATITFHKEIEFGYQLSSDFAESLNSSGLVNKLSYSLSHAPFSGTADFTITGGKYAFTHTDTTGELWDAITQGDILYLHTNQPKIVEATWYSAECIAKIPFANGQNVYEFQTTTTGAVTPRTNVQYILDDRPGPVTDVNVDSISLTATMYTFIQPYYDKLITIGEGIDNNDGTQENDSVNTKDIARFKVWLKTSELWKIEYMNYLTDILAGNFLLTLSDTTKIVPGQLRNIYTRKNNENLIDLHEFDFIITYNNIKVNPYRT